MSCFHFCHVKTLAETLRKNIKDEMQRKIVLRAKIDKTTNETEHADVFAKEQQAIVSSTNFLYIHLLAYLLTCLLILVLSGMH